MDWYLGAFKKYAQFSGRARRKEYWMFMLFYMVIYFVLIIFEMALRFPYLGLIYSLITFIPVLSIGVRRKHDIGRSGWFVIIPLVDTIMACFPGTIGPNKYGPDPKENEQQVYGAADYERPYDVIS